MSLLMRSCAGCGCATPGTGHKAIVAMKNWHGRFPFTRESCIEPAPATPDLTKYLVKTVSVLINSSDTADSDCYDSEEVHRVYSNVETFHAKREFVISVGRYTGLRTQSACVEERTHTYTPDPPTAGCSGAYSTSAFFTDLLCYTGGGSYPIAWVDVFGQLDACAGRIYWGGANQCSTLDAGVPPRSGTPTQWQDWFATLNPVSGDCTSGMDSNIVTLSNTAITMTIAGHYNCANSGTDLLGHPYSYSRSGTWSVTISIVLSSTYTSAQVNTDVETLLATRNLTNMTDYGWHYGCVYPLVHYDEAAATEPIYTSDGDCAWVDPNSLAPFGWAAAGFTGDVINGTGSIVDWFDASAMLGGAFKQYGFDYSQSLLGCKYAEIIVERPSHNWYRPCGPDDMALEDMICTDYPPPTGCNLRYPDAWHLCGRVAVSAATQNGANVDVTLADNGGLVVGDKIDFTGVAGLGANVNVDGIAGGIITVAGTLIGTYTPPGGYVQMNGSPNYLWNDETPRGDYFWLSYEFDERDMALDPDLRYNVYGMPRDVKILEVTEGNIVRSGVPSVVSLSPDGSEDWATAGYNAGTANASAYAFPTFAMPLACDERFGARWHGLVHQRMYDPIDGYTVLYEGPGGTPSGFIEKFVEARATVPTRYEWGIDHGEDAPALPEIEAGGCSYVGPVLCPDVNIRTISQIATLMASCVGDPPVCPEPDGLIKPPLVCYPFDDDIV